MLLGSVSTVIMLRRLIPMLLNHPPPYLPLFISGLPLMPAAYPPLALRLHCSMILFMQCGYVAIAPFLQLSYGVWGACLVFLVIVSGVRHHNAT